MKNLSSMLADREQSVNDQPVLYWSLYSMGVGLGEKTKEVTDHVLEMIEHRRTLQRVKYFPLPLREKLEKLKAAKKFFEKHEDKRSGFQIFKEGMAKYWGKFKRGLANISFELTPWEMTIKKIESHFGTVVSSYFVFLRWMLWVNIILTVVTIGFIVIPEVTVGHPRGNFQNQTQKAYEKDFKSGIQTLVDVTNFDGYLRYTPIYYGYYGEDEKIGGYNLPVAYFMAGLATYAIYFIVHLRRMAKNSHDLKISSKGEQFSISWTIFTAWDFMIGIEETAGNKRAEIVINLKEVANEEREKMKEDNKALRTFLRILAHLLVCGVMALSAYIIFLCVERWDVFQERKTKGETISTWENIELSVIMTLITAFFPIIFDTIGLMENYHPRTNVRWQLARILVLYLLNLYTFFYALYKVISGKIPDMNIDTTNRTVTTVSPTSQYYNSTLESEPNPLDCWEDLIGQEVLKLVFTDTWLAVVFVLIFDFIRGLFVRFFNPIWCWNLERTYPGYGDFDFAENILHLIYNQATVCLGTFFVPVLPAVNMLKLLFLFYLRGWAVMVCNSPHERVVKASGSNNFYLAISLLMLFLSTCAVGFLVVVPNPSSECGPFRHLSHDRSFKVLTDAMDRDLPETGKTIMSYMGSPGVAIPVFLLAIMAIYYLTSLIRSVKLSNKDLRDQLLYERTEMRSKMNGLKEGNKNVDDHDSPRRGSMAEGGGVPPVPVPAPTIPKAKVSQILPKMTRAQLAAYRRANPNVKLMPAARAASQGMVARSPRY